MKKSIVYLAPLLFSIIVVTATITPQDNFNLRGYFSIYDILFLNVSDNMTTPEICLNGDCRSSWPTGGGSGVGMWQDDGDYISPNSSYASIVNASTYTSNWHTNISDGQIETSNITATLVGIGTGNPNTELHVEDTSNVYIRIESTSAGADSVAGMLIKSNNTQWAIRNQGGADTPYNRLVFREDNDEWLTIFSGGLVEASNGFSGNLSCTNITGATSNLCTLEDTDTTIGNCSVDVSCDPVTYDTELDNATIIRVDNGSWVQANELDLAHDTCVEITDCVSSAYNSITNFSTTLTDTYWCRYNSGGSEINCDVAPYTDFGVSIDDSELTSESFGDFTCDGGEDGCTINTDVISDNEIDYSTVTLSDFTVDNHLNMSGYNISNVANLSFSNPSHLITDNSTCVIIKGDTSEIHIC